jgi:outer membrane protein, multidrug efflux system
MFGTSISQAMAITVNYFDIRLMYRTCIAVGFAGLFLTLPACTSLTPGSNRSVAIVAPESWSNANSADGATASSLAQWWSRFNDSVLSSLVDQALQRNTNVASAQAALLQARALRDVAAAGLLPTLGASASAQRSTNGNNNASNSFRAGLDAGWELDVFGANHRGMDTSEASLRASAASLGDVRITIAAEVALAYIQLRSTQARLGIANSNLTSQLETLQITQWRWQAGLVTALEVEQAQAQTEQTRAQLPALQTSIGQTRHAIAVLIGQPPGTLPTLLATVSQLPQAPGNIVLSFPLETLRQRPDVRVAENQVAAAQSRVAQADAARAPNFKLGGSIGLSALALGSLTNGASIVSSILASVSMPIFDGGASNAQLRAQQAALDQALIAYQAVVLKALREVEDALIALRGDRERLLSLEKAASAADGSAVMATQRYSSGLVDFQTVLETQRSRLATQDSVENSKADISADHVRLYKALGGGWNPGSSAVSAELMQTPAL